jgi:hypothetical protein
MRHGYEKSIEKKREKCGHMKVHRKKEKKKWTQESP